MANLLDHPHSHYLLHPHQSTSPTPPQGRHLHWDVPNCPMDYYQNSYNEYNDWFYLLHLHRSYNPYLLPMYSPLVFQPCHLHFVHNRTNWLSYLYATHTYHHIRHYSAESYVHTNNSLERPRIQTHSRHHFVWCATNFFRLDWYHDNLQRHYLQHWLSNSGWLLCNCEWSQYLRFE